jgi:hypothetical protein
MAHSVVWDEVMTEGAGRCNSTGEGVFHDIDPALAIDERQIDADIGQKAFRFASKEFVDGRKDTPDLRLRNMRGGQVMCPALLDFDEDNDVAVTANQINLAGDPAPVSGADRGAAVFVMARHGPFSRVPRMKIRAATVRPVAA